MPLYVAEIGERPTVVFAASDHVHALGFTTNQFLRTELQSLRTPNGASLLPVDANVTIRAANELEHAAWEADLAEGLRDQTCDSREDAIEGQWFAFLIDYLEPDE